MKTKHKLGIGIAAGASVALTYGGFAAAQWLSYGRKHREASTMLLDRYMHDAELVERSHIQVNAPARLALETARRLDLTHSPMARTLFGVRTFLMGEDHPDDSFPRELLDQVKKLGWEVLDQVPDTEIVVGAVTKPWEDHLAFRPLPSADFASFGEPGWVQIVWNISVEPVSEACSLLWTEMRARTTDSLARKRFRRFWAIFSPGVLMIRRDALKIVKREAEAAFRGAPEAAVQVSQG